MTNWRFAVTEKTYKPPEQLKFKPVLDSIKRARISNKASFNNYYTIKPFTGENV